MRILFICRLFSGFEDSLKSGVWEPKGAPTIAHLVEALDRAPTVSMATIMTVKKFGSSWPHQDDRTIHVAGLQEPILVLTGESYFRNWPKRLREKFSELRQIYRLFQIFWRFKPDLIYCDRVNIAPAALFSRLTKTPVVWRVMGVLEDMHRIARKENIRDRFICWLWRSPFAAVICTLEGSGGQKWMETVLSRKTHRHLLLNGVDTTLKPQPVALPKEGIRVLFAGRIEKNKGAEEFLAAMKRIVEKDPAFRVIFAGDGTLRNQIEKSIDNDHLKSHFTFLGNLTPRELKYVRQNCDIYVSLNKQGNLSNVNLEALSDGLLTIVPSSSPATGVDIDTDHLIPHDSFYRFGAVGDTEALVAAILKFKDAEQRTERIANTKELSKRILISWQERIQTEIGILQSLIPPTAIIIADLGAGGAQKIAVSLAAFLAGQGRRVTLITLDDGESDFHPVPPGIARIALAETGMSNTPLQALRANLCRAFKLRKTLKATQAQAAISFIGPTNILTILATLFLPLRVIVSERNDPARQSFGRLWDVLRTCFYRFADCVTANSESAVTAMRAYVPAKKLRFIPNQLSPPDPRYLSDKKEKIILAVGRLHPQKGFDTLLSAFASVHQSHPDWRLIILGEGPLRGALKAQIKDLGLENIAQLRGTVKNPYEFYSRAPIFILPSRHEGTPNALLEAMSCGLTPIVSDACGGALRYVEAGQSGLVFKAGDAAALAQQMMSLIQDTALQSRMSQAAKQRVAPLYGDAIFQQWLEILKGTA